MSHARESWTEEMRSAHLYRVVAAAEAGTAREALFRELAVEAEKQAAMWAEAARTAGDAGALRYAPDARTRLVGALVTRFGPRAVRHVLAAMKVRGMALYFKGEPGHFMAAGVEGAEHRHRGIGGGGNLRAAVFGANDGLISNASLILGVAGATSDATMVLLTGAAGLVAGAFSMAAGEYVSVRSQREMYEHQIALEREELDQYPAAEAEELALIYAARGIPVEEAKRMATAIISDPERALDALTREELGLNPEDLGSPWGAAAFSFLSFAAGAIVPLVPFLALKGSAALAVVIGVTAAALFGVGAAISLFTGREAWRGGLRMLLIGGAAGAITFAIGRLLGVSLG
jgi:VIT1/CCC1 family predicted Fe2+/Mn2+ transporter